VFAARPVLVKLVPVTPLAIIVVGFAAVPPYTVYELTLQLAGGVTAFQFNPMELEDAAVAVSPTGAEGTALQVPVPVVVPLPCVEAADEPSPSAASTT
jgi:hypothetical protein